MRVIILACALLAAAGHARADELEDGEKVFKKCAACHQLGPEAKNRVGPVLNGVVGKPAGQVADYKYSDALLAGGLTWDEATLAAYLKAPKDVIPGGKMSFAGLKKDEDVTAVIAYIASFDETGN